MCSPFYNGQMVLLEYSELPEVEMNASIRIKIESQRGPQEFSWNFPCQVCGKAQERIGRGLATFFLCY